MTNEQHIENLKKLKSFHNGSYGADIDSAIKALEQTRWIPVSERLPEESGEYLVTFWLGRFGSIVWTQWYDSSKSEFNVSKCDAPIIAWMPLPKPYEPQESEESE